MSNTVLNSSYIKIIILTIDVVKKLKEWMKSDVHCRKTNCPRMETCVVTVYDFIV
jgi:hypothetical protein